MDEKHFKKHLADLAHGHHHPEEHDWDEGGTVQKSSVPSSVEPDEPGSVVVKAAKPKTTKAKAVKKTARKK